MQWYHCTWKTIPCTLLTVQSDMSEEGETARKERRLRNMSGERNVLVTLQLIKKQLETEFLRNNLFYLVKSFIITRPGP